MRIMGIDAGLTSTGVAIYDTDINDFILVTKIRTSIKKATPTRAKRIEAISTEISHLLFFNSVDMIVAEDIFVNPRNAQTSLSLGWVRGALELTAAGLEYDGIYTIPPTSVKLAVTGNGKADKEAMFKTIKRKYKKSKVLNKALGDKLIDKNIDKNDDMADAACIIDAYLSDPKLAKIV